MNPTDLILAASPILAIIALLALRVRPILAVTAGIVLVLCLSARFSFDANRVVEMAGSLGGVTLAVAIIMFGGILLSTLLSASGAQGLISDWLNRSAGDPARAVLLIGLGVTPFMESTIGWGAGVIVGAPLLIRAGLSPSRSCAVALLGLYLCPWGTLGSGLLVISELSGTDAGTLGPWIAVFNLPVSVVMSLAIYAVGIGRRAPRRLLVECLGGIGLGWAALLAANLWVSAPLAGVLASLATIIYFLVRARLAGGARLGLDERTRRALAPYGLLMATTILGATAARLLAHAPLAAVAGNPAPWMVVTLALTPRLLGLGYGPLAEGLRSSARQWLPVFAVTALFLAFGALLATNGMSSVLAAAASELGERFLPFVPLLGSALGYITTSTTATAALAAPGLVEIAQALQIGPAIIVSSMTATAGAAIMASPARMALAASLCEAVPGSSVDLRRVTRVVLAANLAVVLALTPAMLLTG